MLSQINALLGTIDNLVWGVPLIVVILATGVFLTARMGLLQIRKLPLALKYMFLNEEEGHGEVSSFGALCTALSATIGTGNTLVLQQLLFQAAQVLFSGCGWLHSLVWQQNIRKVFLLLNTEL